MFYLANPPIILKHRASVLIVITRHKHIVHLSLIWVFIVFTIPPTLWAQEVSTQEEAEAYEAFLQDLDGLHLNLNKASQTDLLELPGITPNLAWRITVFRPFKKVQDLHRVPGITSDVFEQITPYLSLKDHHRWQGHFTTRLTRPTNAPNQLDHMRFTQRTEIQLGDHLTGFILTDRDPKEPNWADYLTAHLQYSHKRGQLIIGDLRPEMGQGLLHSRQTRSSASLSTMRPRSQNRVANRNSTEFGAIRGIHLTTHFKWITLQALLGQAQWDAHITDLGDIEIRRTEQHATETTINRKNILKERVSTLHTRLGTPQNHVGITLQKLTFSPASPKGISTTNASFNGRIQWHQTTLFGEMAFASQSPAFITGLTWQKETLRLHLLARHYNPTYLALHGAPIAAYGTPPQNERGFFFGFTYRPTSHTRFELSLDRHQHIAPERYPLPNQGQRFRLTLRQRLTKTATVQLTHSVRKTRYDPTRSENRVTLRWTHRAMRTTTWVAQTHVTHAAKGFATGVRMQIGQTYRLALWTTTYHIPTYDARIYDFEPDVWGSGTLQTRTGKGYASGMLLAWSSKHFRMATRYSLRKTNHQPASSWAIQFELHR